MMRQAAICCVLAVLSAGAFAQEQTAKPIDYDTFCKLPDQDTKRAAFLATTAEIRATLVRTQMERWRDANQARLNAKQKTSLAAVLKSITAETYADGPQGEEARIKSRALTTELEQLFTRDELNAMQPYAPCIARK